MIKANQIFKPINTKFTWNYKVYKLWFRKKPGSLKWILLVILTFPFFAATWEMKKSFGLSPLQILGMLVFMFSFLFAMIKRTKAPSVPLSFRFFLLLLTINLILVFSYELDFSSFGDSVRIILPFVLFFYFRKNLNTLLDFEGFLITFLIASIFPISTLYYEIIFNPIREVYNTESRGGGLRLSGFYSDLFGYMSHLICGFICYCYFYIKNVYNTKKHFVFRNIGFLLVILIFLVGIYNLRHQASWAVSLTLITLFVYFIRQKVSAIQQLVFLIIAISVGFYFYTTIFETLFAKDISVYHGNARETAALNGRVWIWKRYFAYWEEFSSLSKLLGVGLAQHEKSSIMMSGGMHNDYVRLFFSTGIVGFSCYILFLFNLTIKTLRVKTDSLKFIMIAVIISILMYSISSLPLLASGAMMYFFVAIIAQIGKTYRL